MASTGAGQGSRSAFISLAGIAGGRGGPGGDEIAGDPADANEGGLGGRESSDIAGPEQASAVGAAPHLPVVAPCCEPKNIVGFRWHVTAVMHSTQVAEAELGAPLPDVVAALGPWPACSGELRRCQNQGAHSAVVPHFVCTACLEYTQRLLRALAPALFEENLWLPFCRRCSLSLHARNRDGQGACICPIGEPSDNWMFNGKLFCVACRVETIVERRVRNEQAWRARAQGRKVQVVVNGALVNSLAKDKCVCLRNLDGGDVWACPMCSGVRPE